MEQSESSFFVEFSDRIMTGEEYQAFLLQARGMALTKDPEGYVQRVIRTKSRTIQIDYYLSVDLKTLFVLTAHIVRAGEPRTQEKKILQEYLKAIKEAEERP